MDIGHPLRQDLLDRISNGALRPGQRLPTEREMCEQYGLSRTTVRRVLAHLKDQGLVVQTVGSGTYVSESAMPPAPAAGAPETISPAELMEARIAFEPSVLDLVIRNARAEDFQRMLECCDRAEAATSLPEFEHWDGMLHQVIAEATHNSFVRSVFSRMTAARDQDLWGRLKQRSVTPERRLAYQREHRALVDSLRDRDAETARRLALEHLLHVRRNLLGD